MRWLVKVLATASAAVLIVAIFLGRAKPLRARQSPETPSISAGSILLANEKMNDPNFAESVILIVDSDPDKGAMGLIVNRQTELSIAKVFPKAENATKDPLYMGGPVELTSVQALLRLPDKAAETAHVVGDVYVSGSKKVIDKSISSQTDPSKFRLYIGYAGWGAGQLQAEMRLGAWSLLHGNSKVVFDPQPDTLWTRLTRESHMRMALLQQNLLQLKLGVV